MTTVADLYTTGARHHGSICLSILLYEEVATDTANRTFGNLVASSASSQTVKAGNLGACLTVVEVVAVVEVLLDKMVANHRAAVCTRNARCDLWSFQRSLVKVSDHRRDLGLAENGFEGGQKNWHIAMTMGRNDFLTSIRGSEAFP